MIVKKDLVVVSHVDLMPNVEPKFVGAAPKVLVAPAVPPPKLKEEFCCCCCCCWFPPPKSEVWFPPPVLKRPPEAPNPVPVEAVAANININQMYNKFNTEKERIEMVELIVGNTTII